MRVLAGFTASTVTVTLLAGCALPTLMYSDRDRICTVGVAERFESATFRANPLANPVGGPLGGAGLGALAGLQGGIGAIFTVPLFAAVGAIGGAACGAGSLAYPDADARFQAILATVDTHSLARALSAGLSASISPDSCGTRNAEPALVDRPDVTVELEALEVGMACPVGRQQLWASVRWRVLDGEGGRVLAAATTRCGISSELEFGDWFTDASRARAEIELVLAKTGQRIAAQMFAPRVSSGCTLQ